MNNAKTAQAIFREANEDSKRANKFKKGPLVAQIVNISGLSEQARVIGFPTRITIQHPFLSINSWIRGLPEIGAGITAEYAPETNEALFMGYRQKNPEEAIRKNLLYQELLPGELESMSSGLAHSFKASRPVDLREAGLVRSILDGDTSSLINRAVTYVDILHQHEVATLKDTRRLGVVRRPTTSVETKIIRAPDESSSNTGGLAGAASAVASAVGGNKQPFAKENTLVLVTKDGNYLIDSREGNVVDDDGTNAVNDWTGKYLRFRKKFYNPEQNSTYIEIDSAGNVDVCLPEEAESGFRCRIMKGSADIKVENEISVVSTKNSLYKASGDSKFTIETGFFVKNVEKDNTITIKGNSTESVEGKLKITSQGNATIQADKTSTMSIGGFLTNLGQDGKAKHPLLFGDDFIQAFMQLLISLSTHVHPGISVPSPDLASACIQLAAKCPTFVSMNVQTQ